MSTKNFPTPSDLGITSAHYAYCYCEENIYRAAAHLLQLQKEQNQKQQQEEGEKEKKEGEEGTASGNFCFDELFVVFISPYVQANEALVCFPGSWLMTNAFVTFVSDPNRKNKEAVVNWDYHVILVARTKASPQQQHPATFVCDFDSALCTEGERERGCPKKFVRFEEYVKITFAQTNRQATRCRVIRASDFVDQFSSTRAHMLPPPAMKAWLADPARRWVPPPAEFLQEKPHASAPILKEEKSQEEKSSPFSEKREEKQQQEKKELSVVSSSTNNKRKDLCQFINMSPKGEAPGVTLALNEFIAGKF